MQSNTNVLGIEFLGIKFVNSDNIIPIIKAIKLTDNSLMILLFILLSPYIVIRLYISDATTTTYNSTTKKNSHLFTFRSLILDT